MNKIDKSTTKNNNGEKIPRIVTDHTKTVHNSEPDFERAILKLPKDAYQKILSRMVFLYGEDVAEAYMPELERILKVYYAHKSLDMIEIEADYNPEERFTEKDVILITYGDILHGEDRSPLATLAKFCDTYLEGTINTIHILPFFPYSSDRGFSIVDFDAVDPRLGSWQDIEDLEERYQLMFDGVINHVSSKSRWFQEFLNGAPYYRDFFISYKNYDELSNEDRSVIFRPRTTDILSKFYTVNGPRYVWATFSSDQIDLNYKNPNVLIRVLEILLHYVRHGADIIRLDAVTYLWAEPGTRCIHLEQTHEIVKLFRDILNIIAPRVAIITETNVPHEENISYFGNGYDEAQMVYNFALPPLVLYTFYKGDATILSKWADSLKLQSKVTTFFNFLDSHDGVGLMAVKNILTKEAIDLIIKKAEENGGLISYKTAEDGSEEPYEINITWFSALNKEDTGDEDIALQVKRFVASRIIALVIKGVPGIYLHGLIGTQNDIDAVKRTQSKRDINRTVLSGKAITESLNEPFSKMSRINRQFGRLLTIRTQKKAFHPNGVQHILFLSQYIFSVLRISPDEEEQIITLTNITNSVCHIDINLNELPLKGKYVSASHWYDIVSCMEWEVEDRKLHITLEPYDVLWLDSYKEKNKDSGGNISS
ncbi:MAG: sugar phosphorylase [Spirochaetota bacterium]|nr:sugar phosphorylase [Spirochaetota bacterium]